MRAKNPLAAPARAITLTLFTLFVLLVYCCNNPTSQPDEQLEEEVLTSTQSISLSYKVPGDLPAGSSETDLAIFAWNEFIALNWAASYPKDKKRGTPDQSWDFATSGPAPALSVWETYVHRNELSPVSGTRSRDLSSGKPHYAFSKKIDTTTNKVSMDNYWVLLDEDNEIGSCYLFAYDSLEVLYMAKTNLEEYNYVKKNYPTGKDLKKAISSGKGIPYLTKVSNDKAYCNSDTATHVVCLPCGSSTREGAIEIKTAWRLLIPGKDDPSRFITKEAVYFTQSTESSPLVAHKGTLALIGMHIIHKTENYPAFIFASWEQVDVRSANMQIIGLDDPKEDGKTDPNIDPHHLTPVVERAIPASLQKVTQQAWAAIKAKNPASAWQYYQLIGVQGEPIDYADRAKDDNYFMANYVIESDSTLTFFHGSFGDPFNSSIQNVVYNGKALNMGGCQGCHGQAQQGGSDFSFLLTGFPAGGPEPMQTVKQALEKANPGQLDDFKANFK